MYHNEANNIALDAEPIMIDIRQTVLHRFLNMLLENIDTSIETLKLYVTKLCKLLVTTEIELAVISLVVETLNWTLFTGMKNLTQTPT